jgi:hypothetical protein
MNTVRFSFAWLCAVMVVSFCGVSPRVSAQPTWQLIRSGDIRSLAGNSTGLFCIQAIAQERGFRYLTLRSNDNGVNWSMLSTPTIIQGPFQVGAIGATMYAGGFMSSTTSGILRSLDNGLSWFEPSGLPRLSGPGTLIGTNYFGGNSAVSFLSFAGWQPGVTALSYRSLDGGSSWQPMRLPPMAVEVPLNAALFTSSGVFIGSNGVRFSSNNGQTWSDRNTGLPTTTFTSGGTSTTLVNAVFALCMVGNTMFALTATENFTVPQVYVSTNNGESWTSVSNGLPRPVSLSPRSMVALGNTVYVGTRGQGVFASSNNGLSWSPLNNGLPSESVTIATMSIINNNLYIGTATGLYRLNMGTSVQKDAEHFALRLFPQPTADAATLEYTLSAPSVVETSIVTLLGTTMLTLPKTQQSSGVQRMQVDVQTLPVGMYLVQVNIGGQRATVPLQVVR